MSDPILLFLIADVVALVLLGTSVAVMPPAASSFLATGLCGLGFLLCIPPLLFRMQATALELPIGPPGLSLHVALDSLSACFLAIVFMSGTAVAAFQATSTPPVHPSAMRVTAFCLGGTVFSLVAADGVALAIGLAVACGAIWLSRSDRRHQAALLSPLFVLAAVCLLTPADFAPRFDTIRFAPVDPRHATAAVALTIAAVAGLAWGRRTEDRCWTRNALTAGSLMPAGAYLLLRLVAELPGEAAQGWWGFALLITGGLIIVIQSWRSAAHPDIDGSVACLMRRQTGLAMIGVGLALIARAADLTGAASFALAATLLLAIGGGLAGTLTSLAAHEIGTRAGTYRLSRLGGLVHAMPGTSAALAAGLLTLSALPPGLGFACLWLLLQSILSAPRTGGLVAQVPLALTAAAIALSAALATAASVRLIGVAVLGRPRTPVGAGAKENESPTRAILLTLAGISLLAGMLPRPVLIGLAEPVIRALADVPPGAHIAVTLLSTSATSPGYRALPVLALLTLLTGAGAMIRRWSRKEARTAGPWSSGMEPPLGLPFGEPDAQSAGAGFLPALPDLGLPRLPSLPPRPKLPALSAVAGMWLVLAAFALLLVVLVVIA